MFKVFQEQQQYMGAVYVLQHAHMPACILGCMHAHTQQILSYLPW